MGTGDRGDRGLGEHVYVVLDDLLADECSEGRFDVGRTSRSCSIRVTLSPRVISSSAISNANCKPNVGAWLG